MKHYFAKNSLPSVEIIQYRKIILSDIDVLAVIRSENWGDSSYWQDRISGYINAELHPQHALMPREIFVATEGDKIVGFIAGHLTQRLGCEGELQWIDVINDYRRMGIASSLLTLLAEWFVQQNYFKICVDVDSQNIIAQNFYRKHGAENLNEHWLFWEDISVVIGYK